MTRTLLTALAFAAAGTTASATTYVLDFDADPTNSAEVMSLDSSEGQNITNPRTFLDAGVEWLVTSSGGTGAALFDTNCPYTGSRGACSGDPDLEVDDQMNDAGVSGNVLIQQENGNMGSVDDDAGTAFLTLQLKTNIKLEWTGASALDDGFYIFDFGGTTLGTIDNGDGSAFDNTVGSVDFANTVEIGFDDVITVFFQRSPTDDRPASGAVDNFRFSVVPVPASLPLLIGGFGLMAFMRNRRKS